MKSTRWKFEKPNAVPLYENIVDGREFWVKVLIWKYEMRLIKIKSNDNETTRDSYAILPTQWIGWSLKPMPNVCTEKVWVECGLELLSTSSYSKPTSKLTGWKWHSPLISLYLRRRQTSIITSKLHNWYPFDPYSSFNWNI